jgi:predicted nucleotidyltransferase
LLSVVRCFEVKGRILGRFSKACVLKDHGDESWKVAMSARDGSDTIQSKPDERMLAEVVKRTVAAAQPVRIILFGSAARETMGPDSDLDLLVVVRDGVHRRRTAQAIYQSLGGIGVAKDVVVVTESDVREYGRNPSLVICPALAQGREIYRAAG